MQPSSEVYEELIEKAILYTYCISITTSLERRIIRVYLLVIAQQNGIEPLTTETE
jgi:hypothetical protein